MSRRTAFDRRGDDNARAVRQAIESTKRQAQDVKAPTLQELHRVMTMDARELDDATLAWAIAVLEHRLTLIPETAPAHEPYALRLRVLRRYES